MLTAFLTAFSLKYATVIASILISVAYLPQIIHSHRTKNVKGIALWFWILINLFLVCMVTNAIGLFIINGASALGYLVTELINFAFGFWQLILVIVYGKEDRKQARLAKKEARKGKKWYVLF